MNARESIKAGFPQADMITRGYLGDLTDEELMARPVDGCNHIAWQLGHLIGSERHMVEAVCPGTCPELPEGFSEKHNKETAEIDDSSQFLGKDEYLKLYDAQRARRCRRLIRSVTTTSTSRAPSICSASPRRSPASSPCSRSTG